jgi:hypothetical protein
LKRPFEMKRDDSNSNLQDGETMTTKRTLIEPRKSGKRYVRRAADGQFTEQQVDVGKSLAADRRSHSKTVVLKGQGDRGDQKKSK